MYLFVEYILNIYFTGSGLMSIFNKNKTEKDNATNKNKKDEKKVNSDISSKMQKLPQKLKFDRVVFLDPGFGYSNPGCGSEGYYSYIPNAQLTYELAILLSSDYEVFITQPLNYAGESLKFNSIKNKNKPIHTILKEIKPKGNKIIGYENYSDWYKADARLRAVDLTIDYLKSMNKTKVLNMCSLTIQHNCVEENKKNENTEGMEVFYNNTDDHLEYREKSKKLCENILKYCKNIYGSNDRPDNLKGNNFTMTKVNCPAAYVEIEFIDNLKKQSIISDANKQKEMARGLRDAINKTFS